MSDKQWKGTGLDDEKESTQEHRRQFIAGGAVAAVGALASLTAKSADAAVTELREVEAETKYYHPNEDLVKVIVEAWKETKFREALLTYPELGTRDSWSKRKVPTEDKKKLVRAKLAEYHIHVDNPVVLLCRQYHWGYLKESNEEVFVLPDMPQGLENVPASQMIEKGSASARVAMVFCPFGM